MRTARFRDHAREVAHYRSTLPEFERSWLDTFVHAVSALDTFAIANLTTSGGKALSTKDAFDADNAARRDIMTKGLRVSEKNHDGDEKDFDDFTVTRLGRDDVPASAIEDGIAYCLDLAEKLKSLSYQPYGEGGTFNCGDEVKVCVNNHLYQNATAVVLGQRRKGEYLIEIRSRKAPKGAHPNYNPNPPYGRMYAWADALTRIPTNEEVA